MEQDRIFSCSYTSLLQLPVRPFNFLKRWFIILSLGRSQPSHYVTRTTHIRHTYVIRGWYLPYWNRHLYLIKSGKILVSKYYKTMRPIFIVCTDLHHLKIQAAVTRHNGHLLCKKLHACIDCSYKIGAERKTKKKSHKWRKNLRIRCQG
jgi:hypothetical protein